MFKEIIQKIEENEKELIAVRKEMFQNGLSVEDLDILEPFIQKYNKSVNELIELWLQVFPTKETFFKIRKIDGGLAIEDPYGNPYGQVNMDTFKASPELLTIGIDEIFRRLENEPSPE